MNIENIIKKRQSTRAYTKKRIEDHKKYALKNFMTQNNQKDFRFRLVDYTFDQDMKISTYGMISGAHSFIIGIMNKKQLNKKAAAIRFGNTFEEIILKATALDLDTCWMVSTFNDNQLKDLLDLKENEAIAMVSPVGYGNHSNLKHRLTRFLAGASKRKPWETLFFHKDFKTPLEKNIHKDFIKILEAVRLSPSAANKQPWRIVKNNKTFDFYIEPKSMMKLNQEKINVTYNDMGIAQCHFKRMAEVLGYNAQWFKKDIFLSDKIYVGSFALKGD